MRKLHAIGAGCVCLSWPLTIFLVGTLVAAGAAPEDKKPAEGKAPAPGLLEILKIGEEKKEAEPKAEKPAEGKAAGEAKEEPKKEAKEAETKEEKPQDDAKDKERKKKEEEMKGEVLKIIQTRRAKAAVDVPPGAVAEPTPPAPPAPAPKKESAAPKKKAPEPPMFRLRDGTRLAGTPDLKLLHVATPYGKLEIPVNEIVQIRFAASHDPVLAGNILSSIEALGSEEFDRREEAMAALRRVGAPAAEALKKALASEDEEVKTRAEKLLSEIDEDQSEADDEEKHATLAGEDDEVVTLKFTAMGRVEEESFVLATRYGTLNLGRKDIVSILFQDAPVSRTSITLPGNVFAAAGKWHDTKLNVTQGEMLRITATGSLNLQNYGQTTTPDGTRNVSGNQLEEFICGSLVGKIGDKGKAFLIGSDFQGSAPASGKLLLGVSIQNGEVNGSYQVEVETEGGG